MSDFTWIQKYWQKPWVAYASGPEAYDCWGLVHAVLQEQYGINSMRYLEVVSGDHRAMHKAIEGEMVSGAWERLDQPVDGCVVLMSQGVRFHHIGIWVDVMGGRVLHSKDGRGVCLENLQALRASGIRKFEYWRAV